MTASKFDILLLYLLLLLVTVVYGAHLSVQSGEIKVLKNQPRTIIIEEVFMIKDGASVLGMKEEILLAYTVAMDVYRSNYNVPAVLTEGTGGKHGAHTHHKKGMAMDLRVRNVDPMFHQDLTNKLKEALGREYQVVYETDHIHVEYDPT